MYNNQLTGTLPAAIAVRFPVAGSAWSSNCITGCSSPLSYCGNAERWALVDLYSATNGPGWVNSTHWLVGSLPCTWFGVTCSGGATGSVVYVPPRHCVSMHVRVHVDVDVLSVMRAWMCECMCHVSRGCGWSWLETFVDVRPMRSLRIFGCDCDRERVTVNNCRVCGKVFVVDARSCFRTSKDGCNDGGSGNVTVPISSPYPLQLRDPSK